MEPPTFPSTSHIPADSERDQSIAVHLSKHIRRSRQTHEAPCKRADFASDHMMDEQPCSTGMSNYADIMTSNFPSSPNATPTGPFAPSNQPIPDPSAPFGIDALDLYATSGRKNTLNIVTAALSGWERQSSSPAVSSPTTGSTGEIPPPARTLIRIRIPLPPLAADTFSFTSSSQSSFLRSSPSSCVVTKPAPPSGRLARLA